MLAALDVSIITFRHSDFAFQVSGTGLKGKDVCFPADEELSSWFHASLCLNTSVMLYRESRATQGLVAFEDLASLGA